MPRHQATARARKRKNDDRSEDEDDDFVYTHKQPHKLAALKQSSTTQQQQTRQQPTKPRAKNDRVQTRQKQQHAAVPSLSSSDRDSASPTERSHTSNRTRPVPDKDESWMAELNEMRQTKRVQEEDRGFVFTRKVVVTTALPTTTIGKTTASKTTKADRNQAADSSSYQLNPPDRTASKGNINGTNSTRHNLTQTSKSSNDSRKQQQRRRDRTPERAAEAIVTIPMRETPTIKKNKDLRDGNRRSSFAMRGKRASSIGNGFNALPHPSVDTRNFFRHISAEEPPPIRMKQLMTWCARKCIDEQKAKSKTALKVAKQVEEETLSKLINGEFAVSWFGRQEREPIRKVPKKPHQQNVKNLQKLKEYEEQIEKLRKEDEEWTRVISSFNTFHASLVDSGPPLPPGDNPIMAQASLADNIDLELLTADERSLWEKHCKDRDEAKSKSRTLSKKARESSLKTSTKEQNKWMVDMMSTLEKEVDSLQDVLYGASRFDKVAKQYTDQVLEQIASAIDGRQRTSILESIPATTLLPSSSRGSANVPVTPIVTFSIAPSAPDPADDPRQILRALSRLSL